MYIVVPVKRFSLAKSRLAEVLSPVQRSSLARAMLEDLLSELNRLEGIDGVLVVSNEASMSELKQDYGFDFLIEHADCIDLNDALNRAMIHLASRRCKRAMILHGDLPLIEHTQLQMLVNHQAKMAVAGGVVLVPDRILEGTNCMILNLPLPMRLQYGKGSFLRHYQEAVRQGLTVTVKRIDSLALDVDHPDDLEEIYMLGLQPDSRRSNTFRLLNEWRTKFSQQGLKANSASDICLETNILEG